MFLSLLVVLGGLIQGVQPLFWYLDPAALAHGGGGGGWVFHEYPDAIPPVLAVEVQAQAIPRARGPWETGKGVGAPLF